MSDDTYLERAAVAGREALEHALLLKLDAAEVLEEIETAPARVLARRSWERRIEERVVCVEEAGHVVIGLALGLPVALVTSKPNDLAGQESRGAAKFADGAPAPTTFDDVLKYCTFFAAGPAAVAMYGLSKMDDGLADIAAAKRVALPLDLNDRELCCLLDLAGARAQRLVRQHFTWLNRVVAALESSRVLTGAEVLVLRDTTDPTA